MTQSIETGAIETRPIRTKGDDDQSRCRFLVAQTPEGRWRATDHRRSIARDFATRKEAIHFALFETGSLRTAVLLAPEGDCTPALESELSPTL